MDLARRREIDALAARCLEAPPGERASLLAEACGDDADLRRAVEELLARAEEDDTFLTPGGAAPTEVWEALAAEGAGGAPEGPGQRIGVYRLEEEIGHGGMAVAFRAVRDDGEFEQRVALKLLRPGPVGEDLLRRFRQERQILASLRHPNIAQLLDGGVTDAGRPYFVLELVEGLPIDRYCDEAGLGVEERLRLFVEVGRAVQHAHRHLVVHRDLKPANVLVAASGQVKLLDFGIAKLEDPETWPHAAPPTRTVVRLMTPEYASPEQVRGERVTTATDVYQLGVVLYELLAGRRPFRLGEGGQAELERRICEESPARPSDAVDPAGATLARRLRGDLDTIVLTCLRKEPERRYASVAQLVADVERHLAGRPVAARPDTASYRVSKFVRRHRAAVTAAAVATALVLGLAIAYTVGLAEARRRAEEEARKAERVVAFLTGLFREADPARRRGEEATARELLARGRETIDRELAEEPRLRAELLRVMGGIHAQLGRYGDARDLLDESVKLHLATAGEDDAAIAAALSDLGWAELYVGEFAVARKWLEEALDRLRRADDPDPLAESAVLGRLGVVLERGGDVVGAAEALRRSIRLLETARGPDDADLCTPLNRLGNALSSLGDLAGARGAFERCLAIAERTRGPGDPGVARVMDNLAEVVRKEGRAGEALALHRRSTAILRRVYGDAHPSTAVSVTGLGLALAGNGDLEAAAAAYRESIAIYERSLGPDVLDVTFPVTNLADTLRDLGRPDEAWPLYERALAIRRERLEPGHGLIAIVLFGEAVLLARQGEAERAEALHREALALRRNAMPAGHHRVGESAAALGALLAARGDCATAAPLLAEATEILAREPTEERWLVGAAEEASRRCAVSAPAPA